jgi:hypothetical protein
MRADHHATALCRMSYCTPHLGSTRRRRNRAMIRQKVMCGLSKRCTNAREVLVLAGCRAESCWLARWGGGLCCMYMQCEDQRSCRLSKLSYFMLLEDQTLQTQRDGAIASRFVSLR